jgi:hypothetical protein
LRAPAEAGRAIARAWRDPCIRDDPRRLRRRAQGAGGATHTRLGLFNFLWGGLRIADIRNPDQPAEIGYFRPGDACTGHVRYLPAKGQIWLTCVNSGFWVLAIKPELLRALR